MKDWLQMQSLWRLVNAQELKPVAIPATLDADGKLISPAVPLDADKLEKWEIKAEKAAGAIRSTISHDLKVLIRDCEDDPCLIWSTIKNSFVQQRTAPRFNAYHALLSMEKAENESLDALINRVDQQIRTIKSLSPSDFDLDDLYDELAVMAMIRALPHSFDDVVRTISVLDAFKKQTVIQALRNMDITRSTISSTTSALSTASGHRPNAPGHPSSSNASNSRPKCDFCSRLGHVEAKCFLKEKLMKQHMNPSSTAASNSSSVLPSTPQTASISSASALSSSLSHNTYSGWNVDTGASAHMTFHRHWLRNYRPHYIQIKLADGSVILSEGIGTVRFEPLVEGQNVQPVEFTNVLYVPALRNNLLSVFYLTMHRNFRLFAVGDSVKFIRDGNVLFEAKVNVSNSAFLQGDTIPVEEHVNLSSSATLPVDLTLWHRRLCHHHIAGVKKLIRNNLVDGLHLDSAADPDPVCEPCKAGKMHADPFPPSTTSTSEVLQLVHCDVHGPVKTRTQSGYRYWVIFVDDYTRHRAVYLLTHKSQTFGAFKQYKSWSENITGKRIKCLRDDKGGEFISKEFDDFCSLYGIERQHTARNRPQQNGVAERANRTMEEAVVAMLHEAGAPLSFWGEAISSFIHVWNMVSTSSVASITPHQAFYGVKPDVSRLRVWGCIAYVLVQKDKRPNGSLGSHMEKCIFIGYPQGYKAWRFYNPVTKKVVISERADFDERFFMGRKDSTPSIIPPDPGSLLESNPSSSSVYLPSIPAPDNAGDHSDHFQAQDHGGDVHDDDPVPAQCPDPVPPSTPQRERLHPAQSMHSPHPRHQISPSPLPDTPPIAQRRPQRTQRPRDEWLRDQYTIPHHYRQPTPAIPSDSSEDDEDEDCSDDPLDILQAQVALSAEPASYRRSQLLSDAEQWHTACEEEMEAHRLNGTWDIVKLPPGKKAVGSRWFMKIKHNADGSLDRYKARLVAKGYSQRPGFDFHETFAPTVRYSAVRAVLAIAALQDMELRSLDISHAYLNGELEEEIYMQQPEGFEVGGPDHVCKLHKSLYGLKQAGRVWNKKLHSVLLSMGFSRIQSDNAVYVYLKDQIRVIVPVFVDDITLASKDPSKLNSIVQELGQHFKIHDLGPTTQLLGISVHRDRSKRSLSLCQHQYIKDMLQRYGLHDCKPVSTPMEPGFKLSTSMAPQNDAETAEMHNVPYLSAVGSLMYLAVTTRPDISYSVGVLARFNSNPGPLHWKAVKHLLRYLKGTIDHKIVYAPTSTDEAFITYSDADHGGNPDNLKSTGGYVVKIGSGAVSWSSKLQSLVALSTTEAEYVAAVEAGKEIIWFQQFLGELGYPVQGPSVLRMDNQSAIAVAKNPEHYGRMKHLDLRLFWLRDAVDAKKIEPVFISTDEMAADILTKALDRLKVQKCRELLGLKAD
jgi:transposase InsO family protein